MFVSNALIGLREGLEAALVVVILLAFLAKTNRRWAIPYVWLGVGTAVGLSVILGAVLTFGTRQLSFEAQELIGGTASIIAVAFVTVMVFWMKSAARTISGELKGKLDKALDLGPLAVALVGFLGVGREGLETAIFFYATAQAAGAGNNLPLLGWAVGLGGAIVLGWLIYRGALKINLARFFRWTGVALVLVAGGILSYGIHDLQEAGFLPGLNALAFDVSGTIEPGSWYAVLLKGTLNFTPQTTWLQAIAWVLYVGTVMTLFLRPARQSPIAPAGPASPSANTQSIQPPQKAQKAQPTSA
ncbi:MAG: iron uptake transporter permease EfeU [Ornithinibacter sp.]